MSDIFDKIVQLLGPQAQADIADANTLCAPQTPEAFADEIIYIICNAGMRNSIAREIHRKCMIALKGNNAARSVFGHPTKSSAIDLVWRERAHLHAEYMEMKTDSERLEYLESLPWIGPTTKYHAAKSFGLQIAKPDRHLERLASLEKTTPQLLCERLAEQTGLSVPQVDTILWRACSLNILDSNTGKLTGRSLPANFQVHLPERP